MPLIVNEYVHEEVGCKKVYTFGINLPRGAKVLSARVRHVPTGSVDYVTVHAEVDTEEDEVYPRTFCVLENGYGIPKDDHFGWLFLCSDFGNEITKHIYVRII